jgi:hypothetical protein
MIGFYLCEGRKHPNFVIQSAYLSCPYEKELLWLDEYEPYKHEYCVTWGIYKATVHGLTKNIAKIASDCSDHIIIEMGYIGRGNSSDSYYSLSKGGINGYSSYSPKDCPPDRAKALGVKLQPWKTPCPQGKGNDLIIGQVSRDSTVQHSDHNKWINDELQRSPNAWFRPHPKQGASTIAHNRICTCKTIKKCLKTHNIGLAITFNSTSGVETVTNGCPTVTKDRGSMVWDISSHDGYGIFTPDREQWLRDLAYRQYKVNEIPWDKLIRTN